MRSTRCCAHKYQQTTQLVQARTHSNSLTACRFGCRKSVPRPFLHDLRQSACFAPKDGSTYTKSITRLAILSSSHVAAKTLAMLLFCAGRPEGSHIHGSWSNSESTYGTGMIRPSFGCVSAQSRPMYRDQQTSCDVFSKFVCHAKGEVGPYLTERRPVDPVAVEHIGLFDTPRLDEG